jgi:hypothetical protein
MAIPASLRNIVCGALAIVAGFGCAMAKPAPLNPEATKYLDFASGIVVRLQEGQDKLSDLSNKAQTNAQQIGDPAWRADLTATTGGIISANDEVLATHAPTGCTALQTLLQQTSQMYANAAKSYQRGIESLNITETSDGLSSLSKAMPLLSHTRDMISDMRSRG